MFKISICCPPHILTPFLARHGTVEYLWIQGCLRGALQPFPPPKLRNIRLPNLKLLAGPPWYLLPILDEIHALGCIQHLRLDMDHHCISFNRNYLSAILNITQHFTGIEQLKVFFFGTRYTVLPADAFDALIDEHRRAPAKSLYISIDGCDLLVSSPSCVRSIILTIYQLHCHSWLKAFPDLESVELQSRFMNVSKELSQDLEVAFARPDNPFDLRISSVYT